MILTIKTENHLTKIYINGILHLAFVRAKFVGIYSWKDFEKYTIELIFNGGVMRIDYDSFKKWKAVLKVLDGVLYP